MKRGIKWALIITGGLVILVVAAVVAITLLVDVNKYKPVIEQKVAEATGRSFSIGGDLRLSIIPTTAISFADLQLGNPPDFKEESFVNINAFEARIKFWPFLTSGFKDIQVERFVLDSPRIALVRKKDGRANWENLGRKPAETTKSTTPPEETGEPAALPLALVVNDFSITNGTLIWDDQTASERHEVTDLNLNLKDVSFERPIGIDFSARYNQKPVGLSGKIGPLGRSPGQFPIDMDLTASALKEVTLKIVGTVEQITQLPRFDLDIQLAPFSPRKAAAEFGQPLPIPPSNDQILQRVSLNAKIKGTPKAVSVSNGHLVLDETNIKFSVKSKNVARPDLAFDMDIDQIELDRYLPPPGQPDSKTDKQKPASRKGKKARKPADDPIKRLRMDGKITIGKLTVNHIKVQDVHIRVKSNRGVFQIDPAKLTLYGGQVASTGRINLASDQPSARLQLNTTAVDLNPLIKDLQQKDIIEGALNSNISLSFTGDTADSIKRSLNSSGNLQIVNGALKGIDLVAMVRNVDRAYGLTTLASGNAQTDFTQIQAPFKITNGVFRTTDTKMVSELIRVVMKGKANLVNETLAFRIVPTAVTTGSARAEKIKKSEVTVPVIVSGTFQDPKFRPDLEKVAQKVIEKEILESKEYKKALEKNPELKQLEEPAKQLLKGIFGN